jgi:hypothetical protein
MKLHQILIGVLFLGLIATAFLTFINDGVNRYSPEGYNSSYFESLNQTSGELVNLSEGIKSNMSRFKGNPDLSDVLLGSAYMVVAGTKATWIATSSTGQLMEVSQQSVEQLPVGNFGGVMIAIIGAAILIAFIIGIVLYSWIKSDRL